MNTTAKLSLSSLVMALSMFGGGVSADTIIGNFEGVPDSALDWAGGSQVALTAPKWTYSSTVGVTLGSQSLHLNNAGYQQSLDLNLNFAQRQAFMANTMFSIDITYPAQTFTSGFSQIYQVALNAPGFGFNNAPGTANPVAGSNFGYGGPTSDHTFTLSFDYSTALPAIIANVGVGNTPGYVQIVFASNSDANHPDFYFDNARLFTPVPEPASGLLLLAGGGLALGSMRRRANRRTA